MKTYYTEQRIEELLMEILLNELEDKPLEEGNHMRLLCTYEQDGIITNNKGLVLRMEDGTEFQITIVRSR